MNLIFKMDQDQLTSIAAVKQNRKTGEDLIKLAANSFVNPPPANNSLPEWIDRDAIKAGQDFVRRHIFLVFFTHFLSLLLLLSYIPVKVVLLKTRRSHTKELALRRYLSTILHVKLWYEGDISSQSGSATQDVIKVQKIHSGVNKRLQDNPHWTAIDLTSSDMNNNNIEISESEQFLNAVRNCSSRQKDTNEDIISPTPTISQLDMIVTQYCFMGLLTTFPAKFGIHICSSPEDLKGIEGFSHLWAVVGHLLGIDDRFNLCIGDKTELKQYILQDIILKNLSVANEDSFVLWKSLVSAMSVFVPCLSLHAAFLYFFEIILKSSCKITQAFYEDATFYDMYCYKLTSLLVLKCFRVGGIRYIFNGLLRIAIYITSRRLHLTVK